MMRGMASTLEKHHRVQILDEALEAAVRLSHRYIPARQLPDKSVSLLDTACARVAISQHAVPPKSTIAAARFEALETELEIIGREEAVGSRHRERRRASEDKARRSRGAASASSRSAGRTRSKLAGTILEIRATLRAAADSKVSKADSKAATKEGAGRGRRRGLQAFEPALPSP